MIIDGRIVEFEWSDDSIRMAMIEELAKRLAKLGLSEHQSYEAALLAFDELENELQDAASYRWLRDGICRTMADPDAWDGDEGEEEVLLRYVGHLAQASHGNCERCGRRIKATEQFEQLPDHPGDIPHRICRDCI